MSSSGVQRALAASRLLRVHKGVYAVGRPPTHALERAMAAVLACGDGGALSGAAGLALWELGEWPRVLEVTSPHERRIPGLVHRRCRTLSRRDVRRRHAIPVLSPARLILERAPHLSHGGLARIVNEALRRRLVTREGLAELLSRRARQPGASMLRSFTAEVAGPTRSELEDSFREMCARFGLPQPETCVVVDGYEVDAFFRAEGVIVELDGWRFHGDRESFETDRERDAHALAHGNCTLRLTHARLASRPAAEAERLQRILQARRHPDR